jgi:hypothetical protein
MNILHIWRGTGREAAVHRERDSGSERAEEEGKRQMYGGRNRVKNRERDRERGSHTERWREEPVSLRRDTVDGQKADVR